MPLLWMHLGGLTDIGHNHPIIYVALYPSIVLFWFQRNCNNRALAREYQLKCPQTLVVDGEVSNGKTVLSGVSQGSVLGSNIHH